MTRPRLFHVSDEPGIARFEPRPSDYTSGPVVWAIAEERLCNYLVPRDCPRVTYYAGSETAAVDIERFLGSHRVVVTVESGWMDEIRSCRLHCYYMPPDTFECVDACAGYHVSPVPVVPLAVEVVDDPLAALVARGVDLRVMPNLWELHDAVVASTLQFSCIRMRNARPR